MEKRCTKSQQGCKGQRSKQQQQNVDGYLCADAMKTKFYQKAFRQNQC